jgi:hypothetical protein
MNRFFRGVAFFYACSRPYHILSIYFSENFSENPDTLSGEDLACCLQSLSSKFVYPPMFRPAACESFRCGIGLGTGIFKDTMGGQTPPLREQFPSHGMSRRDNILLTVDVNLRTETNHTPSQVPQGRHYPERAGLHRP